MTDTKRCSLCKRVYRPHAKRLEWSLRERDKDRRRKKSIAETKRQRSLGRAGHCINCSSPVEEINILTGKFYRRCLFCRSDQQSRMQMKRAARQAALEEHRAQMDTHYPR